MLAPWQEGSVIGREQGMTITGKAGWLPPMTIHAPGGSGSGMETGSAPPGLIQRDNSSVQRRAATRRAEARFILTPGSGTVTWEAAPLPWEAAPSSGSEP